MKFDELLYTHLGEFGRYQRIQLLLVCIPTMFTAMHSLSWTFTSAVIPHRCYLPGEDDSSPYNLQSPDNFSVDLTTVKCEARRGWNVTDYLTKPLDTNGTNETCTRFKWDHSEITKTAISEWNIICDRAWIRPFIQSMYYVGQFLGSIVFGVLGDKIGRKRVFLFAISIQMTCGVSMAFVPHWILFAILRVGVGFCHPGIFVIAVVIGMELVGPSKRRFAGVVTGVFYAIGQMVLGLVAYGLRNYQHLQLAVSITDLVFISYWCVSLPRLQVIMEFRLVPESARWLTSRGRVEEADKILKRAAKCNKVQFPENWHQEVELETDVKKKDDVTEKKMNFFDLFRTPHVRWRILIMFFCWPVVSGVYYGLSMNPTFFGGDRFFTFVAAGFMEIPGLTLVFFTIDRWGRKVLASGGYFAASACLLTTLIVPESIAWLKAVQIIISKAAITSTYAAMYTFAPELFPTVVRNTALGSCSMMARVGAISASYVSMYLVYYSRVAMVLLFGSFSLAAGLLTLMLPETAGRPLPESIEDLEISNGKSCLIPCRGESKNKDHKEPSDTKPLEEEMVQLNSPNDGNAHDAVKA